MPKAKRKTNKFSKLTKKKKQQMNYSFAVFVGWILILWGSFYFVRKFVWQSYTTSKIISDEYSLISRITFPSINQEKDVITTHVENGEWLLVDSAANYVYESSRPGKEGAVIIYGHNTSEIFADLGRLNFNDPILVEDNLGRSFSYKVVDKKVVNPDAVENLEHDEETLVLYTCTGFLDTKRLIILAKPIF